LERIGKKKKGKSLKEENTSRICGEKRERRRNLFWEKREASSYLGGEKKRKEVGESSAAGGSPNIAMSPNNERGSNARRTERKPFPILWPEGTKSEKKKEYFHVRSITKRKKKRRHTQKD